MIGPQKRHRLSIFIKRCMFDRLQYHASTLVVAEHEGGAVKGSSVSAIEAARALEDGNSISVLLAGSVPKIKHRESGSHQNSRVLLCMDFELPFRCSPITDVIALSGSSLFIRPIYAGNALCTVRYTGTSPCVLTIRSTSFPIPAVSANSKSNEAPISQVDLSTFFEDSVGKSRYVQHTSQDTERPDLGSARIVVTVGATRAAVDAGFVPNDLQVADYGLVGDLFEVIPELLEKLPEKK
ncbi:hypothetical protein GH714_024254 [Hevea brasiliensis]|uniref:Electron transfer flavoprotein alpha/beta-subunit N-terminal domain-containing protein n=1 Tax=Hevea brasiliensis TaxID=3981 RepID=A0A6A6MLS4_HEVBR|nr:hypothetical protein GH714_024254 [Hevea brasiliensis]